MDFLPLGNSDVERSTIDSLNCLRAREREVRILPFDYFKGCFKPDKGKTVRAPAIGQVEPESDR